jgi:hypothetical protein
LGDTSDGYCSKFCPQKSLTVSTKIVQILSRIFYIGFYNFTGFSYDLGEGEPLSLNKFFERSREGGDWVMSVKKIDPLFDIETVESRTAVLQKDYDKKLRRRIEDRIRKDKEALYLVARVLNIR